MPPKFADINSSQSAPAADEPYDSVCEIASSFYKGAGLVALPELPLKKEIKRCQTIFWYEYLRKHRGLLGPRAMQKFFEPKTFVSHKSEGFICSNKWRLYRLGEHKPHQELVDRVDKSVPGSAEQLRHPLWEVLNVDEPIGNEGRGFLNNWILNCNASCSCPATWERGGGQMPAWLRRLNDAATSAPWF